MKGKFLLSTLLLYTVGLVAQEAWNVDADGNWGDATKWIPMTVPNGVGVSAAFGSAASQIRTISLDISPTVGVIAFDSAFGYRIQPLAGSTPLTLSSSSGSAAINLTNANGDGDFRILSPLIFSSNLTITSVVPHLAGGLLLGGVLSGPGSVTINGPGPLVGVGLSASNTYTGGTTVTNTFLGLFVVNTLPLNGALTLGSNTTVECNSFSQTIGTLTGVSSSVIDIGTGTLTLNTTTTSNYAGMLTGVAASNVTIQGSGVLNLTGTTTYAGTVNITGGTLGIGANNALDPSVAVVINASGILDLNGFSQQVASLTGNGRVTLDTSSSILTVRPTSNQLFSGSISGLGAVIKAGGSTLSLGGVSSYTGGTTVTGGALQLSINNALSSMGAMTLSGGDLDISPTTAQTIGTLSGSGNIAMGSARLTVNGLTNVNYSGVMSATPGSFIYQGPATLTLDRNNLYTGGTIINGGILQLGAGTLPSGGDLTINSPGVFNLNGHNQLIGALSGSGNITLGVGILTMNTPKTTTYNGSISGAGGAVVFQGPGMLTMTGTNSYTGGTTVSGGTLQGNTASLQGNINNTATLVFNETSPGTFSGTLTGAGSLVIAGSAPLTLLGALEPG